METPTRTYPPLNGAIFTSTGDLLASLGDAELATLHVCDNIFSNGGFAINVWREVDENGDVVQDSNSIVLDGFKTEDEANAVCEVLKDAQNIFITMDYYLAEETAYAAKQFVQAVNADPEADEDFPFEYVGRTGDEGEVLAFVNYIDRTAHVYVKDLPKLIEIARTGRSALNLLLEAAEQYPEPFVHTEEQLLQFKKK